MLDAVSFADACRRLHNHGTSLFAKHATNDLRHDIEATVDASNDFIVAQDRATNVSDETGANLIGAVDASGVTLASHRNGDERAGASIVILGIKETGGLRSLTRITEGIPGNDDFLGIALADHTAVADEANRLLADAKPTSDGLLVFYTVAKHRLTDLVKVLFDSGILVFQDDLDRKLDGVLDPGEDLYYDEIYDLLDTPQPAMWPPPELLEHIQEISG